MRVLFVGEQSGGTVKRPAFGYPRGSADRLAKMLGMSHEEMLERFEFINLMSPGTRDPKIARRAATKIERMRCSKVVLLGRKVAEACEYRGRPHLQSTHMMTYVGETPVLLFPHPSGRNRLFNDPRFKRRCERVLRRFVSDP